MTSDIFKSRVEAAQDLGRIQSYPDEKRRLLSLVAMDFSYSTLQRYFCCSSKSITAARVSCILFGRGGVPSDNYKFTRQCVSAKVLMELTGFFYRDDVSHHHHAIVFWSGPKRQQSDTAKIQLRDLWTSIFLSFPMESRELTSIHSCLPIFLQTQCLQVYVTFVMILATLILMSCVHLLRRFLQCALA